jgi:hypothetical protein
MATRSPAPPPAGTLLTPAQTAERLQVEPRTLKDWRYRRVGPPFIRLNPRCVRYRQLDLDRWVAMQAIETRRPASASSSAQGRPPAGVTA